MPLHRLLATTALLPLLACAADRDAPPADPAALDPIAYRYVTLALGLGAHDPNYVDAYYGPDSLKTAAEAESLSVTEIAAAADSLIAQLGDTVPMYGDSLAQWLRQIGQLLCRPRLYGHSCTSF